MRPYFSRWLILSLILHLAVYGYLVMNAPEPLDGAIESVSFDINEKPHAPAPSQPKAPTKVSAPSIAPSEAAAPEGVSSATTSEVATYESGNVSIRPRVLKQVQVAYPEQAKSARIEGSVKLSVIISEMGQVKDVKIMEGPGYGLNEAAEQALRQFLFSPAEVEGRKVPVQIVYIYRFKLETR